MVKLVKYFWNALHKQREKMINNQNKCSAKTDTIQFPDQFWHKPEIHTSYILFSAYLSEISVSLIDKTCLYQTGEMDYNPHDELYWSAVY